jgi:hypothetical protein
MHLFLPTSLMSGIHSIAQYNPSAHTLTKPPPASAYNLTNLNPNPMKTTPTDFRRWQIHIRKECVNCNRPDKSETIKPWSVNWTLLGRILQAKNA